MSKRNLEFFMTNPDQVPGNLDELEAVLAGAAAASADGEVAETTTDETGEQGAASGANGGEKVAQSTTASGQAAGQDAVQAQTSDATKQVIKSKNGQHDIPYSVLESERDARRAAEAAMASLQEQFAALKAQLDGKTASAPAPAATPDTAALSEEDIQRIEEDFPATGKAMRAMLAMVQSQQQLLQDLRQSEDTRTTREAKTVSQTAQEAIDANPTLSYLQAKDPEMFGEAVRIDNLLKANPRNHALTLDERFTKVVSTLEAAYGPVDLPAEFRSSQAAAPAPAATSKAAAASKAATKAEQIVAEAEASTANVRSLSDIPGGVAPESDEITALGMLSASDLGNKFMKMDMTQIASVLARAA